MNADTIYYLYHKISPFNLNYLGVTKRNPYNYRGSGKYWRRHLKKHNIKTKDIITIVLFSTNNIELLEEKAKYYSKEYDMVSSEEWANLTPETGNNTLFGFKHNEESKKKMSESRKRQKAWNKGITASIELKKKLSQSHIGHPVSDETKEKIRKALIGNKHTQGFKHSNESKMKISNSNKGKTITQETKVKISKSHCGKHIGRKNVNYNPAPVLQFDKNDCFIKEWKDLLSLKEAGFNKKQISKVCRGILKSSANSKWKFKTL
jgi:hypothetical protein